MGVVFKAIRLGSHNVEVGGPTGSVDAVQVARSVHVKRPCLHSGGKASGQDPGCRVDIADLDSSLPQEACVGLRIYSLSPPMVGEVGFIPDLVVINLVAITGGEGVGEAPEIRDLLRWGVGIASLAPLSPRRRGIEYGDEVQPLLVHGLHDAIPGLPGELSRLRLDLRPREGLPHPVETRLLDLGQGLV